MHLSLDLHESKTLIMMEFHFQKEYLDLVLVPCGLLIMFGYHLFLLHRYLHCPLTTSMGFENHNRKKWVQRIMQMKNRDVKNALEVLSSNTSSATFLATVSITISSLIGTWIASSSNNVFQSELIYGDTRTITISIKYICLLTCFLLAFSCFVQSTRHFVHGNYLICTPDQNLPVPVSNEEKEFIMGSVERAVIRGTEFWTLGLRALYLALNFLLWFFGPIPMFVSSIVLALVLHWLDYNSRHVYPTKLQKGKSSLV